MKNFFLFILVFWGLTVAQAQVIGFSPLQYNPEKYYASENNSLKSLYPAGSKNFYVHDTVNLPFVDDFSQWRFKGYEPWHWQVPVDSITPVFRFDTLPNSFPFTYLLDTTYHYEFDTNSNTLISKTANPDYKVVLYGNAENPFIPVDTITVWEITSPIWTYNTTNQSYTQSSYHPDGTFTDDSTVTIKVFYPIPDSTLWVDNFTYQNRSMGIHPPTIGVVIFDGTDEFGKPYSNISNAHGVADRLTSVPINLAGYEPSDNVYLSFFYQPQGRGYPVAVKDSLVLEFYSPQTQKWHHVLNIPGAPLDTFKQKMVWVNNPIFLHKGFRFRFKNYAELSGNLDHWNLDYVRLDANRSATDTLIKDVAFVEVLPTFLNRYTEMPYTQFTQPNVESKWRNLLVNLDNQAKTICYKFELIDQNGTVVNKYTDDYTPVQSDTNDIDPVSVGGYPTFSRWYQPDFNYNFLLQGLLPFTDSVSYIVKHYIENFTEDVNVDNDTVIIRQNFHNVFAYDDATAEQALWLGTPGNVAVKFTCNYPDTLRAIQYYFSPVGAGVDDRFFQITVWDADKNVIYAQTRQIGILPGDTTAVRNPLNNGYTTYYLSSPVALPAGDFYVGWYQNQTYKINIGFDKNRDSKEYIFYKTTGVWNTLSTPGSLMIRPMVGPAFDVSIIGVDPVEEPSQLTVYPNPADHTVYFSGNALSDVNTISVVDISGKVILSAANGANSLDVSSLPAGFYFLHFAMNNGAKPQIHKIIISH